MASLVRRFALPWAATALGFFVLWLLLADNAEATQLYLGLAAAGLAATGSELVRHQRIAQARPRAGWLRLAWRPVASVPADLWKLTREALRAARRRRGAGLGRLRALPFDPGSGGPRDNARHAVAELAGSFSPNTFVIGVDVERGLLLVHQLVPDRESAERSIDPLELR